jgi:hypothetical protein
VLDRDDVSSVQKISNRRSVPDGCVVQPEPFSPALFSSDPPPPLREQFEEPSREAGQMPRSVISAVTSRAGVTSKA